MLAGEAIYGEYEALAAIAGGLAATLPHEEDFYDEKLNLTWKNISCVTPRFPPKPASGLRLFQDMMSSVWGGHKLIDALHGGGSPVIEKVAIYRDHNIEHSKNIFKNWRVSTYEGSTKGIFRALNSWLLDRMHTGRNASGNAGARE